MKLRDIKCVYVSSDAYDRLAYLGLIDLACQKPIKKYNAWFSKSANCWIDPEVFKKTYGIQAA